MTREEAIKVLNTYDVNFYEYTAEEIVDAIEMAIEALQNKSRPFGDCSKCIHTYGTLGCCTTVSNEWVYDCEHGMEQYENTSVPPADRPQKVIAQITFDEEKLREIVKEAVERFKEEYEITDRPRGEWINENGTYYANCSKCGYQMDTHEERGYHNFCPNCGADMRGEDE